MSQEDVDDIFDLDLEGFSPAAISKRARMRQEKEALVKKAKNTISAGKLKKLIDHHDVCVVNARHTSFGGGIIMALCIDIS